jgi:hypothetical protein
MRHSTNFRNSVQFVKFGVKLIGTSSTKSGQLAKPGSRGLRLWMEGHGGLGGSRATPVEPRGMGEGSRRRYIYPIDRGGCSAWCGVP